MAGSKVFAALMDGFVLCGNPRLCVLYYDDLIALLEAFDDRTADGWTLESIEDYFLVGVLHFKDWEDEERDAAYLFKHAALKIAYNTTVYPYISHFFYLLDQVESKAPLKNLMSWQATCSDCVSTISLITEKDALQHAKVHEGNKQLWHCFERSVLMYSSDSLHSHQAICPATPLFKWTFRYPGKRVDFAERKKIQATGYDRLRFLCLPSLQLQSSAGGGSNGVHVTVTQDGWVNLHS
jgi:hypothetical protein